MSKILEVNNNIEDNKMNLIYGKIIYYLTNKLRKNHESETILLVFERLIRLY